ncbi:MAG: protein phosphatase 2C domain-containing protein [Pirellula sp.]|nr:protein phosphatase 2C domain-containing protein [Pirellula sp.]
MSIVRVSAQGVTHRGNVREENQDQFLITELAPSAKVLSNSIGIQDDSRLVSTPTSYLFIVADGMGGHLGGREASTRAIRFFLTAFLNDTSFRLPSTSTTDAAFTDALRRMLVGAHHELIQCAKNEPELKGMGTTLTAAYVKWPKMVVVHAGDTRCYLKRGDELILLTRDHTVANEMMRAGRIDPAALERSHWSNVLVNALGAGANEAYADITTVDLRAGDRLMMCSDGLNKHATDEQIKQIMSANPSLEACATSLLNFAMAEGGSDNITILLSDFNMEPYDYLRVLGAVPSEEKIAIEFPVPYVDSDTDESEKVYDEKMTATFDFDTPNQDERTTGDFSNESISQ